MPTWATILPFHKLTEEPYRCVGIAPVLDEYVDDIAVLVDGAIEIMLFATNADKHLVNMPGIAMPTISPT
jgi:hypothetical protein